MKTISKQNIIIGIIISVLLSLFVNYSLFAMNTEIILSGDTMPSTGSGDTALLLFSFIWFLVVAFLLYLITIKIIELAVKWLQKEYKAILIAALADLVIVFCMIQLYSIAEGFLSKEHTFSVTEGYDGEMVVSEIGEDSVVIFSAKEGVDEQDSSEHFFDINTMELTVTEAIYRRPVITEHIFILVTVFLLVILVRIIDSRNEMALKIEKLQKENLQSSYNALMGQINPHFFFNSLGGLNSLVRNGEQERTLTYLEELTSVFRYILQSNHKEIVSLSEEMDFVKAYIYLLSIRYEGKLSFSSDIDSQYLSYRLPVLSILPLIENAIKHNVISKSSPLNIGINVREGKIVITNPLQPKTETEECNGIGLSNLSGRYKLLTDKDITINKSDQRFEVQLPLLKPSKTKDNESSNH